MKKVKAQTKKAQSKSERNQTKSREMAERLWSEVTKKVRVYVLL